MQATASRRVVLTFSAVAALTLLAGVAAWSQGRPVAWHAAAFVLALGIAAAGFVAGRLSRGPWHLERAPQAVSLENLQVVPRYYLERLASLGIFTITSLRRADPELTALGIGATPEMVHRWQARAELHLLDVREDVLGWKPEPEQRWPGMVPGTGAFGRGPARQQEEV